MQTIAENVDAIIELRVRSKSVRDVRVGLKICDLMNGIVLFLGCTCFLCMRVCCVDNKLVRIQFQNKVRIDGFHFKAPLLAQQLVKILEHVVLFGEQRLTIFSTNR